VAHPHMGSRVGTGEKGIGEKDRNGSEAAPDGKVSTISAYRRIAELPGT
jgi:L,D-peptidoglycan transpeptidase YkuD (ErfK/YbiS/YcfS/YnhG family)